MTDWEQKTNRITTMLSCWLAVKAEVLTVQEVISGCTPAISWETYEASVREICAAGRKVLHVPIPRVTAFGRTAPPIEDPNVISDNVLSALVIHGLIAQGELSATEGESLFQGEPQFFVLLREACIAEAVRQYRIH